jgi:hypothetical protein
MEEHPLVTEERPLDSVGHHLVTEEHLLAFLNQPHGY